MWVGRGVRLQKGVRFATDGNPMPILLPPVLVHFRQAHSVATMHLICVNAVCQTQTSSGLTCRLSILLPLIPALWQPPHNAHGSIQSVSMPTKFSICQTDNCR